MRALPALPLRWHSLLIYNITTGQHSWPESTSTSNSDHVPFNIVKFSGHLFSIARLCLYNYFLNALLKVESHHSVTSPWAMINFPAELPMRIGRYSRYCRYWMVDIWWSDLELFPVFPRYQMLFNNKSGDQLETFIWQRLLLSNDGDLSPPAPVKTVSIFQLFVVPFSIYFCVLWVLF